MAIITYPLNGVTYDASDAETYLCTRTSGVFASDGMFEADLTGDRKITIGKGLAWIKNDEFAGKSVVVKEPVALTIPAADGALPRIDRIVLRFDAAANKSELAVLKGTAASAPKAPAVTQTALIYELGLYTVAVAAGSLSVADADITSTMDDKTVCGLMRDGVTEKSADGTVPDKSITTEKFAPDAEAPSAANGVHPLTHAKSGTVHALTGLSGRTGIVSAVFKASAAFVKGNTFTVDGTTYSAKLQTGEALPDGIFASGASVGVLIDTAGKTVNFKAAGKTGTEYFIQSGSKTITEDDVEEGTYTKFTVTATGSTIDMASAWITNKGDTVPRPWIALIIDGAVVEDEIGYYNGNRVSVNGNKISFSIADDEVLDYSDYTVHWNIVSH